MAVRSSHKLILSYVPNYAYRKWQKKKNAETLNHNSHSLGWNLIPQPPKYRASVLSNQTQHPGTNLPVWHHMESALCVPPALLLRQIMKLGPPILLSLGIHGLYLHQVMSPKKATKMTLNHNPQNFQIKPTKYIIKGN